MRPPLIRLLSLLMTQLSTHKYSHINNNEYLSGKVVAIIDAIDGQYCKSQIILFDVREMKCKKNLCIRSYAAHFYKEGKPLWPLYKNKMVSLQSHKISEYI